MFSIRPYTKREKIPGESDFKVTPSLKITVEQVKKMSRSELDRYNFSNSSVELREAREKRLKVLRDERYQVKKLQASFSTLYEAADKLYQRGQDRVLEANKLQEDLNREYQTLVFYQDQANSDEFQNHFSLIKILELKMKIALCEADIYFIQRNIKIESAHALQQGLVQAAIEEILHPFRQNLRNLTKEKEQLEEAILNRLHERTLLAEQQRRLRQEEERRLSLLERPMLMPVFY